MKNSFEYRVQEPTPAIPDSVKRLIHAAAAEVRSVDCFDFVPSDYEAVWKALCDVRARFAGDGRPSFCEWGSGLGVVTGMAEILGFDASGIEIDGPLAELSRELLRRHGLSAPIHTRSYLDVSHSANVIFVYCWPGRMLETQQHFVNSTPDHALLMICHGAADVRCLTHDEVLEFLNS